MTKNQEYAAQYAEYAMEQMRRYGIPASVTLAQGILESSNGRSELSRLGNNHFGVKATNGWLAGGGEYLVYTDDKPNEKFCKYASVADSFEHHSRFLAENKRYAECFKLSPDDWKGWTATVAGAGYASNPPKYAASLQRIIETNGLDKYDRMVMQQNPSLREGGELMVRNGGALVSANDLARTRSGQSVSVGKSMDGKSVMVETSGQASVAQASIDGKSVTVSTVNAGVSAPGKHDAPLESKTIAVEKNKELTSEDWMRKMLSSEDGGPGLLNGSDPIVEMAMALFTSLMLLAAKIDGKGQEQVAVAAAKREIDLTGLVGGMKQCSLSINEYGNAVLKADNGVTSMDRNLSAAELNRLSVVLGNDSLSDDGKRMRVAGIIGNILMTQQVSENFERGMSEGQAEGLRR